MQTKKITLEVPTDTARAFERASELEKLRAGSAAGSALALALQTPQDAADELERILERTSQTARERGLTEAELQALLNEEDE